MAERNNNSKITWQKQHPGEGHLQQEGVDISPEVPSLRIPWLLTVW